MTNWEKIYNEFPQTIKRFVHWHAGQIRKESRNWFIDRKGNFIIEWDPSYTNRFTKVNWDLFYLFLSSHGVEFSYGRLKKISPPPKKGDLKDLLVGHVSIKNPYTSASRQISTEEEAWGLIKWVLSTIENRSDILRDFKIEEVLSNIYTNGIMNDHDTPNEI